MAEWQADNQAAADELFRRHAVRLIALARTRLATKLAGRVDAEDVVQSAYRSFFAGVQEGRFDVQQGGDLWRLLVKLTLHKLYDAVKRHTAGKRDVGAECSIGPGDSLHAFGAGLLSREPSPLAAAALGDEVERIMRMLPPNERRVVELRLQGYPLYEIAEQTSRSLATVCRILDRLKQRLVPELPPRAT